MHSRLSVSQLSSVRWSMAEDLAFWSAAGITNVGLWLEKLDQGDRAANEALVTAASLRVTNLVASGFQLHRPDTWAKDHERLLGAVDTAAALGAESRMIMPGTAGGMTWEEAFEAFAEAVVPVRQAAAGHGIPFGIEHANPLRSDVGFVHTFHDAVDVARALDIKVLMEVNNCWAERGLATTIASGVDVIGLVQVDDYKLGTPVASERVVPGDGDIPLRRILSALLDAGYAGVFDLEILGPRIEDEGYPSAVARSLAYLERMLTELGV